MSLIQTPWTSQPQQAVGIDWSNPITRGLMVAYDGLGNDAVSNSRFTNTTNGVGAKGRGQNVSGSTTIPSLSGLAVPGQSSVTFLVALTHETIPSGYRGLFGKWDGLNSYRLSIGFYNNTLQISNYPSANVSIGSSASAGYHVYAGSLYSNGDYIGCIDSVVSATGNAGSRSFTGGDDAWRLGCWRGGALSENVNGVYHVACAWNRALSTSELRSISQNPWQIFRPLPRRIFAPVASGDPTLYPSLYTNTNSFYAPTVSVGAVTLTPSLFSNSNTFYAATVTLGGSTQTLTPSLYSNTNTFHAPSVTTGAVTLTPSLVTNANAFYGPSVSPGAVTMTPALFSNTNSFFGAVVTLDSDKILSPSLVSNSNSFYGPTVSVGAVSLLPSLFVNSNTFYNHVVGGALTDSEKIDLILDILSNRQTLDATTGIYTLYADDGVTVLKTSQAWEDSEGTQPYRGRGLKRLDALQ